MRRLLPAICVVLGGVCILAWLLPESGSVPVGASWAWALAALPWLSFAGIAYAAWQHWRKSRLAYPDPAGNLPVPYADVLAGRLSDTAIELALLRRNVEALAARRGGTPHVWHYAPEYEYRADMPAAGSTMPATAARLHVAAPQTFAQLAQAGGIGGEQIVFGTDTEAGDLVSGSWLDLYSAGIGGMTGSGKSWTAASLLSQSALAGARVAILDPHAGNSESLTTRLQPLDSAGVYLCQPAQTLAEQDSVIALISNEIVRRKTARQPGVPWIIVADEFPALMRSSLADSLNDLFEQIAQEGRKFGVFGLALGQVWTVARSGSSEFRDALASAFLHRMRPNQARYLTGLTADSLPSDLLDLPPAVCYLMTNSGDMRKLVVPHMTPRDVDDVAQRIQREPSQSFGFQPSREGTSKAPIRRPEATAEARNIAAESTKTPSPEDARIVALFLDGQTIPQIVEAMFGVASDGGRRYMTLRDRVEMVVRRWMQGRIN